MKVYASIPNFNSEDIDYILDNFEKILSGEGFLSTGKYTLEFEKLFSNFIGTSYGIASNSGTSALELIFRSLNLKGKQVIMPSNTFIATANAIINSSCIPVFADCNNSMCLDYADAISRVTKDTAAICYVHIGGIISSDAIKLAQFCSEHGIYFIEDAAQAHGSSFDGIRAGNFGDAAAFSFFSTKVMTTGEGGMITTNNNHINELARSLREFGKVPNDVYTNIYRDFGYNWRMPEISSLMGIRQLIALDTNIKMRKLISNEYDAIFLNAGIELQQLRPERPEEHNYYKYIILLPEKINRERFHLKIKALGVQPSGYIYEMPLHKMALFAGHNSGDLPVTEDLCARHFCLPIHPKMTKKDVQIVCEAVYEAIGDN